MLVNISNFGTQNLQKVFSLPSPGDLRPRSWLRPSLQPLSFVHTALIALNCGAFTLSLKPLLDVSVSGCNGRPSPETGNDNVRRGFPFPVLSVSTSGMTDGTERPFPGEKLSCD